MKYNKAFHTHLVGKLDRYDGKSRCVDCRMEMPKETRTRHGIRSTDECAHVWAQQKIGYGKCYSMYFEGRSIWSYGSHFEIARFISPDVVLFTTRGYSDTTSQHKRAVRSALSHKTIFEVPNFDDHTKNAEFFIELIENQVKEIRRGRAALIGRVGVLGEYQKTAKRYLDMFAGNVGARERRVLRALIRKVFFTGAELKTFAEKAERHEASQPQARETRRRNDEIRWKNHGRLNEDRAMLEALTMNAEVIWGEVVTALTREAWLAGNEQARIPYESPVMLRVTNDEIETSQGAFVPVARAVELFAAIRKGVKLEGFEIGHYTVSGIHDGKLIIGCHRIPMREVLRMAKYLGIDGGAVALEVA